MLSEADRVRLREACETRGAAEYADAIAALAQPGMRMRLARAEGDVPRGATRFGGDPDVPPGFAWPWREGRPLVFIAQIECAAVHALLGECGLPREGLLSFFYDALAQPWGCQVGDRGSSVILHSGPDEVLERVGAPAFDLPRIWKHHTKRRFEPCEARLEVVRTWPGFETLTVARVGVDWLEYEPIVGEVDPREPVRRPHHQVMGWADEVQGPMETECAMRWAGLGLGLVTNPLDVEAPEVGTRREAARADAARWRMVLQVDSDEALGTNWAGTEGRVYFWVREDSLEDGSFAARWAVLQCS